MSFTNPTDVFHAALAALRTEDWIGVANCCDPVSLRRFHELLCAQLGPKDTTAIPTVEMLMRHRPDMPREVAEYQLSQIWARSNEEEKLREELPTVGSFDALRALDPAQAFAVWLDGRSTRRQVAAMIARSGRGVQDVDAQVAFFIKQMHNCVALGEVHDGDMVAYVAFRYEIEDDVAWAAGAQDHLALPPDEQAFVEEQVTRATPRLLRCRRQENGLWRALAEHEFLGIGTLFLGGMIGPQASGSDSAVHEA